MKNTRGLDFAVGLFVLLGIVAFIWLAFSASDTDGRFRKNITIFAKFSNIGSLKVKAPVMVAGVRIGKVSKIQLDPNTFQAVVDMDIDPSYEIPKDTAVAIYTAGLVGEQYLSLDPGGSDKALMNGDELKLSQSAVVLERLIGQFLTSMGSNDKK